MMWPTWALSLGRGAALALGAAGAIASATRALMRSTPQENPRAEYVDVQAFGRACPDVCALYNQAGGLIRILSEGDPRTNHHAAELFLSDRMSKAATSIAGWMDWIETVANDGTAEPLEFTLQSAGSSRRFEARAGRAYGDRVLVMVRDVTEQKSLEGRLQRIALFDPLTELPNRRMLLAQLGIAVQAMETVREAGALILVDLDDFRIINELHGFAAGDAILRQAARRLESLAGEAAVVSHLGGDEFGVLLSCLSPNAGVAREIAHERARKVLEKLGTAYHVHGQQLRVGCSVGLAVFTSPDQARRCLGDAGLALAAAKSSGKQRLQTHDEGLKAAAATRESLRHELVTAIAQEQFELHFQPQWCEERGYVGVEALVRWRHPTRGLLGPAHFVDEAERLGLLHQIDRAVLRLACERLARWSSEPGLCGLTIAVNVSAGNLHQTDFADHVEMAIAKSGAPANRLKLEITEAALVTDIDQARDHLLTLKLRGITVAMDDFGTGYASMAYLHRLPFDQIKIDQSFVRGLPVDHRSSSIVRAAVVLGKEFGLEVIAEGVETEAQRHLLRKLGCTVHQGFLFSKPVPEEELAEVLTAPLMMKLAG